MSYSPAWQAARTARALRREARDRRDTMAATLDMAAPKGSAA